MLKKIIVFLLIITLSASCSTTGGIYKASDPENSEFSPVRTLFVGVAILGVAAAAAQGGGGGGTYENPKWDYLQANHQWACRNATNGQFMTLDKCSNQPKVDNWPNN